MMHWNDAPASLVFHSAEAHIWRVTTELPDVALEHLITRLPAEEKRRAERFRHAPGRRGFVVARWALRTLLGRYLGPGAESLELRFSASGKPWLDPHEAGGLHFSLAHSAGVVLLAFAAVEIGVDVERVRPLERAERIAARVFPPATRSVLEAVPASERWPAFFAAWTQREALVKALGGLLLLTEDPLDFLWPLPVGPRRFLEPQAERAARAWTIAHLPVEPAHAAAVVATAELERVRLLQLPVNPESTAGSARKQP
jgi:4'-phosphopantetheinyl transferase